MKPVILVVGAGLIGEYSPWEDKGPAWCTFDIESFHTAHRNLTDAMRQMFIEWNKEQPSVKQLNGPQKACFICEARPRRFSTSVTCGQHYCIQELKKFRRGVEPQRSRYGKPRLTTG